MKRTDNHRIPNDVLVNQLRNGNDSAYQYIFDKHYALMCKFAERIVGDEFQAESIVLDVILHIWEAREMLPDSFKVRSYLVSSVRNACITFLNTKYNRTEVPFSVLLNINDEADMDVDYTLLQMDNRHPLGILLENEMEQQVNQMVEALPRECREVFKLSRYDNKTYNEIAEITGKSINTVKYHIKNALSILMDKFQNYL